MDSTGATALVNGIMDGTTRSSLCSKCAALELAPEKFIIDPAPAAAATASGTRKRVNHLRPARTFTLADVQLNSGVGPRELGTLSWLEEHTECPLCTLISRAVRRYGDTDAEADPACFWEWTVDGRQTRPSVGYHQQRANVTRRLRISWASSSTITPASTDDAADKPSPREHELYLLFVPPKSPQRLGSNALDILEAGSEFLGRDYTDGGIQALMRKWIDICEAQHDNACGRIEGEEAFLDLTLQTSFGVIDVVNLKLTSLPFDRDARPHRYVALSYVWGAPQEEREDHRTLRSNVFDRIGHGGLDKKVLDTLPRTIQHAIQLVRDMGERYLWVDALCIVQDSDTCWRQNAKSMDLIYGNAHFTICAADGDSADVGLIATGLADTPPETPLKEKITDTVELIVSRPLEEVVQKSVWNSRAWTFQERILSRRCLVFVGGRVYFQCRGANMSQDVYPGGSVDGWSLDWRDSPLRTLRDAKERPIWFYMKCVSLYTGRRLTLAKDIVPAFDGVSQLMARYMVAPFYYCLPASHFDFALLWQPSSAHKRRTDFPSWSWAGWMDREDPQKGAHVIYDTRSLEGCLLHMQDWLLSHTWIDWRIRDGEGNLKDIWNDYSEALRPRHSRSRAARDSRLREFERRREHERETEPGTRGKDANERWAGYRAMSRPPSPARGVVVVRHVESRSRSGSRESAESPARDYDGGDDVHMDLRPRSPDAGPYRGSAPRARQVERREVERREIEKRGLERREIERRTRPGRRERELEDHYETRERRGRDGPGADHYGRWRRFAAMPRQLLRPIPDNPFGNRPSQPQAPTDPATMLPILQFCTWSSRFYILPTTEAEGHDSPAPPPPGAGLVRCHVADRAHDWCGTVILSADWASRHRGRLCQFIALSDAKSFADEECTHWAHYIAKDRDEIEWDLFHVLLIEYNPHRLFWERVGLGKILQEAFDLSAGNWAEIQLG